MKSTTLNKIFLMRKGIALLLCLSLVPMWGHDLLHALESQTYVKSHAHHDHTCDNSVGQHSEGEGEKDTQNHECATCLMLANTPFIIQATESSHLHIKNQHRHFDIQNLSSLIQKFNFYSLRAPPKLPIF